MSAEEILALLQVIARQQQQIIALENALRKADERGSV